MGKVLTHMTMSLDGYIAEPDDQVGELFDWYDGRGGVGAERQRERHLRCRRGERGGAARADRERRSARLRPAPVRHRRRLERQPPGRRTGRRGHPQRARGAAERWPRTTFVDGVEAAIAKAREIAGDKDVTIASANVIQQALDLGLVDEVCVSLVPVLFGEGIPYFSKLDARTPAARGPGRRAGTPRPPPQVPGPSLSGPGVSGAGAFQRPRRQGPGQPVAVASACTALGLTDRVTGDGRAHRPLRRHGLHGRPDRARDGAARAAAGAGRAPCGQGAVTRRGARGPRHARRRRQAARQRPCARRPLRRARDDGRPVHAVGRAGRAGGLGGRCPLPRFRGGATVHPRCLRAPRAAGAGRRVRARHGVRVRLGPGQPRGRARAARGRRRGGEHRDRLLRARQQPGDLAQPRHPRDDGRDNPRTRFRVAVRTARHRPQHEQVAHVRPARGTRGGDLRRARQSTSPSLGSRRVYAM